MIKQENCKIVSNRLIAESVFELVLSGEITADMTEPGQFVHMKVAEGFDPLLRRPISIAAIDKESKTFTIIYRKQGRGTSLLAQKKAGDEVDILGPLGNGFPVEEAKVGNTAVLVGGGVGVPPMFELAKQLAHKGVSVISIIGFQSASNVFYEKQLAKYGEVFVTTADGSYGKKGYVTEILSEIQADIVFACGPTPMLRAIESGGYAPKTYLSLEERMGCGIGACFACVCHTKEDPHGFAYKKVCSDGPVFAAGEVVI